MNNSIETIKLDKGIVRANISAMNRKKRKKKLAKRSALSLLLASSMMIFVFLGCSKRNNQNKLPDTPSTTITYESLDDLGKELDFPKEDNTAMYGNVTGDVDVTKIVEKNGKIYKDQAAADNSANVGKEVVDTNNGSYEVSNDGTVHDKTPGYVIQDQDGNVIEEGNIENVTYAPDGTPIPDGYAWDPVLQKIVREEEVGKYVYADATYYDKNTGEVIINKGEIVTKEMLEDAKKYLTTVKPNIDNNTITSSQKPETTTVPETTTIPETTTQPITPDEGKVNDDGTYSIYGMIFESKADYDQWVLQGYEGYAEINGIMKPEPKTLQKTR